MRLIKYLCQILASIVYTSLFASLYYAITVLPVVWALTLKWWMILLVMLILGGIARFIQTLFQAIIMAPYIWICKDNAIATGYGILHLVGCFVAFVCGLYHRGCADFQGFLVMLLLTFILAVSTYTYTRVIIGFYSCEK